MPKRPRFLDDRRVRIGRSVFHYGFPLDVPGGRLGIAKPRNLLEEYFALWSELRPKHVFELGINRGGSTAMLCELGGLDRLVAVDLSPPVEELDRYIEERGLHDVVRPYYGVDQADRERLAAIVDEGLSGASLDLVVDDASHLYRESRASFEVLFPRLRPGGLYVLEDWRWQHTVTAQLTAALAESDDVRREIERRMEDEGRSGPDTPMSRLILEAIVALAVSDHAVAHVALGSHWAVVRRGVAELDAQAFRLDHLALDQLQLLTPVG